MARKLSKYTPNAPCSVHLLVAAMLWTVIGLGLMTRGGLWLYGVGQLWIILPALLLGSLKSRFMLDRSAQKGIARIRDSRECRCIGGVYSLKTWLLVVVMMSAGRLLRTSSLPKEFLGFLYMSIGWGLLFSSRKSWYAWRQETSLVAPGGTKGA